MALTLTSRTGVSAGYIWHGHVRHLRLNYKMRRALLTRKNSYKKIRKNNIVENCHIDQNFTYLDDFDAQVHTVIAEGIRHLRSPAHVALVT